MASRTIRTPEKDAKFPERLSRGASVAAAAKAAGYGRQRLYHVVRLVALWSSVASRSATTIPLLEQRMDPEFGTTTSPAPLQYALETDWRGGSAPGC
jgi:hypothetical protein